MTVSVINSLDQMLEIRDDWDALADQCRNPLLDFDWHYVCADVLHKADRLHIVIHRNASGRATAIAPLVLNQKKQIEFLGSSVLFEPSDILFVDVLALSAIFENLSDSKYPIHLTRMPRSRADSCARMQRGIRSGLWLRNPAADAPALVLGKAWDEFFGSLSSKRRNDFRRAVKRSRSLGTVTFECHAPTADRVSDLLQTAFDIEDNGWKGRNGSSLKRSPGLRNFFERYSEKAARQGTIRIFFQKIGGEYAAMGICVEKYDSLWFLKIGYDERFSKYSPGVLLLMNIVRHSCETGLSCVEHLGTAEPWLNPWTNSVRQHTNVTRYPTNLAGATALARDTVGRATGLASRTWKRSRRRGY